MHHTVARAALFFSLVLLCACGGGGADVRNNDRSASAAKALPAAVRGVAYPAHSTAVTPQLSTEMMAVAINAGGGAPIQEWRPDSDYNGGQVVLVTNPIDTSHVAHPAPQAVYQSQRYGTNITYAIGGLIGRANYDVRMHFTESYWNASGQRLFNVNLNGKQVLSSFDIWQAAGGQNIAIAQAFSATADASGTITIQLTAARDYATIAGIAINVPSSKPTPSPSRSGDIMPWVYSELWNNASPFKSSVAQLKSSGATTVPHTYMDALWKEGIAYDHTAVNIPIYVAKSSDPLLTTVCVKFGGDCNASNVRIHVPSHAIPEQQQDGHMTIVDPAAPSGAIEIDCWQTAISGSLLKCSWAGVFALGTEGVPTHAGEGIHSGMAVSTIFFTAQELVNGHIDHALGMNSYCLNNPMLFPTDTSTSTDKSCDNSTDPPHYGNLVHLLWSPSQIASSPYSTTCKIVLTALATYGAYLDDTGNNGLQLSTQDELSYTADPATKSLDPWPRIQANLNATGDGNSTSWASCLNRVQSSDFELLEIVQR